MTTTVVPYVKHERDFIHFGPRAEDDKCAEELPAVDALLPYKTTRPLCSQLFLRFCPEPVLANRWSFVAQNGIAKMRGVFLPCSKRLNIISAKNATLFSTFPMFVPSLSW